MSTGWAASSPEAWATAGSARLILGSASISRKLSTKTPTWNNSVRFSAAAKSIAVAFFPIPAIACLAAAGSAVAAAPCCPEAPLPGRSRHEAGVAVGSAATRRSCRRRGTPRRSCGATWHGTGRQQARGQRPCPCWRAGWCRGTHQFRAWAMSARGEPPLHAGGQRYRGPPGRRVHHRGFIADDGQVP